MPLRKETSIRLSLGTIMIRESLRPDVSGGESQRTRRSLVRAAGAGLAAGLAVCLGGGASQARGRTAKAASRSHRYAVSVDGRQHRFSIDIPGRLYADARARPRSFAQAVRSARKSDLLNRLGREIADQYDSNSERLLAAQAVATAIPYSSDRSSTGRQSYVRYPAETLAEDTGDCEDLAIVLMGVLASPALGFQTGLIVPKGHCAVLVARTDVPSSCLSTNPLTVTLSETEYVYVESVARRTPGNWARNYGNQPLLAAYRHHWYPLNVAALGENFVDVMKSGNVDATWQFLD